MTSNETRQPAGYDDHNQPDPALLSDCVHCGFCLPTCPTYVLWGEEMDSPRGRIYLMDLVHEGAAGFDETLTRHFDSCLGCMACVTSCPSGVQYDKLLTAMRPQLERNYQRSRTDRWYRRAIFALFPYPRRLRVAAAFGWLYQRIGIQRLLRDRLSGRLGAAASLLPDVRLRDLVRRGPSRVPAVGKPRRRVALLAGCVQRVFFGPVNEATVRVLAAEGCEVLIPEDQGCCGALSEHVGREEEALIRARNTIETFRRYDVDDIVVNVAGCGSTMKEYGHLLRDDPAWAEAAENFSSKVKDVTEVLAELEPRAPRHPIHARVAYHDACHLAHAQRVREQPRNLLRGIPGIELLDIPDSEICCGSAGVFNLLEPNTAAELGMKKAEDIRSTDPHIISTGNPGCLLQIGRYISEEISIVHPVELLDRSIRGEAQDEIPADLPQ